MPDVQRIFNEFHDDYVKKHRISYEQYKALQAIMRCRTPENGGRKLECDDCGGFVITHNSCRNKHCPKCQGLLRAKWVDARLEDMVSSPYFHVVLTVPEELRMMIYQNKKLLYNLMYKAASEAILELAASNKFLGAQIGFIMMLHTWGEDLIYHPHLHCIVLAGGLTVVNQWRSTGKKFFIPVKTLSKVFRGKFLFYLKRLHAKTLSLNAEDLAKKEVKDNSLNFYGRLSNLREPEAFNSLIDKCYKVNWYTYVKETFSSPDAVIRYIGRYTNRVAISDDRIVSVKDGYVTIKRKKRKKSKISSSKCNSQENTPSKCDSEANYTVLDGEEFIRRFLMHVLPDGFVKIRYYGVWGNKNKKTKLMLCKKLTGSKIYVSVLKNLNTHDVIKALTGKDISLCPHCKKGSLQMRHKLTCVRSP